MRISRQQNIQTAFWTAVYLSTAIWALVESFQENYFSNANPGSKTASIVYVIVSGILLLSSLGIFTYVSIKNRRVSGKLWSSGGFYALLFFIDLVFLLNVWKTNGVFFEKESIASLTFIRVWLFISLFAALFMFRPIPYYTRGTH